MKKDNRLDTIHFIVRFFLPIFVRNIFITPAILFLGTGVIFLAFTVVYFIGMMLGEPFWIGLEGLVESLFNGKSYYGSLAPFILQAFVLVSFILAVVDSIYFRWKGRVLLGFNKVALLFFILGMLGYVAFFILTSYLTEISEVGVYVTLSFLGVSFLAILVAYFADWLLKLALKAMDTLERLNKS